MSSPEWRTQQLVIAKKRRQLDMWQSRLEGPGMTEAGKRQCAAHIGALQKVIAPDEAATQQMRDLATKWVGGVVGMGVGVEGWGWGWGLG